MPKEVKFNTKYFFIMKIPNKRERQQIAINHSSDVDFKEFMKIYEKYTAERYSFLVNDKILPSDNPLRFRKNLLEQTYNKSRLLKIRLKMKKAQYNINREAAKISTLSSGKIDEYEYLTGEEILHSNQQQVIEKAKFIYSPLVKAFEKQTKTTEDQGGKKWKQFKIIKNNWRILKN